MTRAGCSKSDGLSRILWGESIQAKLGPKLIRVEDSHLAVLGTLLCFLAIVCWHRSFLRITNDLAPYLARSNCRNFVWSTPTLIPLLTPMVSQNHWKTPGVRHSNRRGMLYISQGDLVRTDTSFLSSPISGWGESSVHRGLCPVTKSSAVTSSVVWYSVCLICTRSFAYTSMASKKIGPIADLSQMLGLSPSYLPLCHFWFVWFRA